MIERMRRTRVGVPTTGLLVLCALLASCASPQVTEMLYTGRNPQGGDSVSVYLEPFSITSYDFTGEEEICAIMDRKLAVALFSENGFSIGRPGEQSDFLLVPELIVKRYQQRYAEHYYYLMSVKVTRAGELVGQYNYEYNGTSSIFDGKVQTSLIERFVDDFARRAVPR